jgi:tryptophan synthase alpha chain
MEQELKDSKITAAIQKSNEKPAFIPFIVCGYPSIEATKKLLYLFETKHAAAIELGIPFSDPIADGPVIQAASKEAIDNGMTLNKLFEMLSEIKNDFKTPLIIFSYFNLILHYGVDKFIQKAQETNVSGFIIPDLPYEEAQEFNLKARNAGIDHIMLVAPTSDSSRIKKIAQMSSGFIYLVSSTGVTGVREGFSDLIANILQEIKAETNTPVAVGFGVSKKEHIQDLKALNVDGVIVGSAIIRVILEYKNNTDEMLSKVSDYIDNLYSK